MKRRKIGLISVDTKYCFNLNHGAAINISSHPLSPGPLEQVAVFQAWENQQTQIGRTQRNSRSFLWPGLWEKGSWAQAWQSEEADWEWLWGWDLSKKAVITSEAGQRGGRPCLSSLLPRLPPATMLRSRTKQAFTEKKNNSTEIDRCHASFLSSTGSGGEREREKNTIKYQNYATGSREKTGDRKPGQKMERWKSVADKKGGKRNVTYKLYTIYRQKYWKINS